MAYHARGYMYNKQRLNVLEKIVEFWQEYENRTGKSRSDLSQAFSYPGYLVLWSSDSICFCNSEAVPFN